MSRPPTIPPLTLDMMNTDAFEVTKGDINDLKTWNLTLKSLAVSLASATNHEDIGNLLKSYKDTLQIFKAFRPPTTQLYETLGLNCDMLCMTELYLWGDVLGSFQFLRSTPNLKVLYLNYSCFEKRSDFKLDKNETIFHKINPNNLVEKTKFKVLAQVLLSRLKHLHLDLEFNVESLTLIKRWMPNLIKLEPVVNNETFKVICREWVKFTTLNLLFGSAMLWTTHKFH